MTFEPQQARCECRINPSFPPPCSFIATAVDLAMMTAAQGHGEFIADLASERSVLRVP